MGISVILSPVISGSGQSGSLIERIRFGELKRILLFSQCTLTFVCESIVKLIANKILIFYNEFIKKQKNNGGKKV